MEPEATVAVAGGRLTRLAAAVLALVVAPAALTAQAGGVRFEAGAAYDLPPSSSSSDPYPYAHAGLELESLFPSAWILAGVHGGLGLDSQDLSWGSVFGGAGGDIWLSDAVAVELYGIGQLFAEGSDDYRAATARGGAGLRLEGRGVLLRAGLEGGVGGLRATVVDSYVRTTRRGSMLYRAGTPVTADLWTWGGRTELELGTGAVRPRLTGEAWDAPQGGYVGGTAGIVVLASRWTGEFGVGGWSTPDGGEVTALARFVLFLPGGHEARFDAARYGPDPLLDTRAAAGGGVSFSVLATRFGESPAELAFDGGREKKIPVEKGPEVRFFLPRPDAASVSLAGDFSGWEELPMRRVEGGWALEIGLQPGVHHYGFVVDGQWNVPEEIADGMPDEWGRAQATLYVSEGGEPSAGGGAP